MAGAEPCGPKLRGAAVEIEVNSKRDRGATTVLRALVTLLKDAGFNVEVDDSYHDKNYREFAEAAHVPAAGELDQRLVVVRDVSLEGEEAKA